MDMSSGEWLSDLGNEEASAIIHHCHSMMMSSNFNMEGFDNLLLSSQQPTDLFFDEVNDLEIVSSLRQEDSHMKEKVKVENNEQNNNGWSSYTSSSTNSSERIISFGSSEIDANHTIKSIKPEEEMVNYGSGTKNNALVKNSSHYNHHKWNNNRGGSTSLCSQEHVLAERRRREKMTERFLALSALIPGLKKMDKASILGDATKYVKQLEEHIKLLEEQIERRTVESVVLVKKSQDNVHHLHSDDDHDDNDNSSTHVGPAQADIEARVSNRNVLIRVHSQKKEGLVQFVLNEIRTLHLTTLNCVTMPFGRYALDITIIAEIEDGDVSMTSSDVVKQLGLALQQFTSL